MRLSRTTLVNLAGQVIVSAAGFGATFAIAVLRGDSVLGEYAVAVSLGAFLLVIPAQATGDAVRKRMSEGTDPGEFLGVGVLVNVLLALLLAGGILLVGALLSVFEVPDAEIVNVLSTHNLEIAALVAASSLFWVVRSAIEGDKRVGRSGLLLAGERLVRSGLQIGFLLVGFGVASLIVGHAIALVVAAVAGVALVRSSVARPTREHVRSVLEYARYAWLGTLRTRMYGWFDTFVLGFFVSSAFIGVYEAAWGLAALLGIVSISVRKTLFPEISELSTRTEHERIRSILADGLVFSGVFAIPGLFGALVIGPRILRFYSPEFEKGAGILVILILAYVAEVYGSQFINVVNAVNRPDRAYRINAVFVTASVILTVSLAWAVGWYGAAVATASASAFRGVLGYHVLADELGDLRIPFRDIGAEVLAAAVMAGVVYVVNDLVPSGRLGTLLVVGVGACVYFALLVALSATVRDKASGLLPAAA